MTTIAAPDLSLRPFGLRAELAMSAPLDVLFLETWSAVMRGRRDSPTDLCALLKRPEPGRATLISQGILSRDRQRSPNRLSTPRSCVGPNLRAILVSFNSVLPREGQPPGLWNASREPFSSVIAAPISLGHSLFSRT